MHNSNRKSLPKRVNDMSKGELEEALKKKKECNAKALQIVEKTLENPVNSDWFVDNLKYIRQSHFDDIVEERAILKICGYPLCSGVLKNVPVHQYHISAKLNKVYDTTERKKYCSNQCYRAGKYLKDQLLTSPLWFSGYEEMPNFKLLSINCVGMVGEEVDLGRGNPKHLIEEEIDFTSINQLASESLNNVPLETLKETSSNKSSKHASSTTANKTVEEAFEILTLSTDLKPITSHLEGTTPIQPTNNRNVFTSIERKGNMSTFIQQQIKTTHSPKDFSSCTTEDVNSTIIVSNKSTQESSKPIDININACINLPEEQKTNVTKKDSNVTGSHKPENLRTDRDANRKPGKPKPTFYKTDITGSVGLVLHVETCLREWFNLETLIFLYGEKKIKEMIVEKGKSIKEYYKVVSNASWDPKLQERYESICKRLNLMELEDSYYDQKVTTPIAELKPLPDYRAIQEEGLKLEMKINAFYQGKVTYVEDLSSVQATSKDDELTLDPLLPLVDTHAQNCYRRKIVQDRLSKVLPDLLRTYGVASRDVNHEFRALVRTFSLEAHNIFFKPAEWNLLGLIIINMLAVKDSTLKAMLDTEQAKNYRTLMLISYQQDSDYIDKLMSWLTDVDNLVDSPKPTE